MQEQATLPSRFSTALGMEFEEIEDWNCCGASVSYAGASDLAIKVLNARNLALAEAKANYDIVAPCSSCYIQMIKVNHEIKEDPAVLKQVNECLAEGDLKYKGTIKVRHIQDVLYNDVGVWIEGSRVCGMPVCSSLRRI